MPIVPQTSTLLTLLDEARGYEQLRDIERESEILKVFWDDFSRDPDTDDLTLEVKGEIFRLCGKFLSAYAKAKALPEIKDYQERGKNLLTKATEIFEQIGDFEKAALARCQIALSYYNEGRSKEADAVLFQTERLFRLKQSNPYYLEIKINHLIALIHLRRNSQCFEIIEKHETAIRSSANFYLQLMFFNQCGMFYNNIRHHEKAEKYFYNAYRIAQKTGNERAVGQTSNNIAYTCRKTGELYKAYDYIRRSISIAERLKDVGWLANYLDTKASIELDLGDAERALKTIELSIEILTATGENISLVESLWTKVEILFALKKTEKAVLTFSKLSEIALLGIGETEAEHYATCFAEKLFRHKSSEKSYDLQNESDDEKIIRFLPFNGLRLENLKSEAYRLFFVPKSKSEVLGCDRDVIVCAYTKKKPNPIVMVRGDEYLLGDLVRDDEMDLTILYTGKNQTEPIPVSPLEADIEGSVGSIADAVTLEKNYLYFEKLESDF